MIRIEKELKALRETEIAKAEAFDKRLEGLHREMNTRFEASKKRFEAIEKRLTFMQWFMRVGFTFISIIIAIFGLIQR
ncbi:MAG: hypothetical protein N2042_05985 [Thermodesulfovibrio sp.]|nr:hypothetical protein [Thermodesulfovibrio sp.]